MQVQLRILRGTVSWIPRGGHEFNHNCPYKREAERVDIHGRRGSVTTEAQIGVMQPQTQECRQPLVVLRGKEKLLPKASRGSTTLPTPRFHPSATDFGLLACRTMRKSIPTVLSPKFVVNLLHSVRKLIWYISLKIKKYQVFSVTSTLIETESTETITGS